ncbi:MAG: hypothetical protein BWY99_02733 [Synergistetes bacterium ADurb.BinA166]|nr:MAG: hypothetical protein BWY99_02733 [Synergistetes bacterium ADurb.BinA166]
MCREVAAAFRCAGRPKTGNESAISSRRRACSSAQADHSPSTASERDSRRLISPSVNGLQKCFRHSFTLFTSSGSRLLTVLSPYSAMLSEGRRK